MRLREPKRSSNPLFSIRIVIQQDLQPRLEIRVNGQMRRRLPSGVFQIRQSASFQEQADDRVLPHLHREVQSRAAVAIPLVDVDSRVEKGAHDALVAAVDGDVEQRLAVDAVGGRGRLRGQWSVFAGRGGGGRRGSGGAVGLRGFCASLVVWVRPETWQDGGWCWVHAFSGGCPGRPGSWKVFEHTPGSGKLAVRIPSEVLVTHGMAAGMPSEQRI